MHSVHSHLAGEVRLVTPAENFAHAIAATFGTQPQRHGREWRTYCPHHEADGGVHRPSLAVWDRPSGYGFKCMTGCSRDSIRAELSARGITAEGGGSKDPRERALARLADENRRQQSLHTAKEIIHNAHVPARGGPVERYLRSRHLKVYDSLELVLEGEEGLVGCICDLTSLAYPWNYDSQVRLPGCSVLSLNKDGTPRTKDGRKFRTIVGTSRGYGVPFGKPGATLLVAEGIESMIAGMELLDVGFGVAVLSASNMANLAVPEWVDKVVVAADNDEPGLAAARGLQLELINLGVSALVHPWEGPPGWDAADELMRSNTCT